MSNGEGLPICNSKKSGKLDKRPGDTVRYERCESARGVLSNVEGTAAIQKSLDRGATKAQRRVHVERDVGSRRGDICRNCVRCGPIRNAPEVAGNHINRIGLRSGKATQ